MTEAEAREYVIIFGDVNTDPVLGAADVDLILSMAPRADKHRVLPSDPSWEPTYDLNHAVAQVWLLKASRLTNAYNFMVHGKMLSRQQMWDHCMAMHRTFLRKSGLYAVRLGEPRHTIDEVELASL